MIKKAALALMLGASSLFAIDSVSNLAVSAPHNTGTVTNDSSVTFTWTPPSGVAKYYYVLDTNSSANIYASGRNRITLNSSSATTVSPTVSASGNYYFHIAAVDSSDVGSAVSTQQVTSEIDLDAGSVNFSVNAGAITTDSNDITLTGTETGKLFYTVDGTDVNTSDETNSSSTKYVQNTTSNPSSTVTLAVGATIKAKLTDQAGNIQSSASSATYTITNNPTIVKANETNTSIDGQTINTSTTNALKVGGTELTRYMYKKSTDASWITVSDINTTISIDTLSSGTYTYEVRGGDAYNFQSESAKTSVTFTVDNTAPSSLSIATVSKGTADEDNASSVTFAGDFQVTLSSDDSNATLYYTTDGSTPTTSSSVYSSAISISSSSVSSGSTGTTTVKMLARDSAGNEATVKSVTFTIDKQQPTLSMPTAQEISSGATLDVTLSSNDSNATIYYLVSDSNTTTIETLKNSGSTGTTATMGQNPSNSQQSDQYRFLHAIAVDIVGNGDEDTSDIETVTYTFSASAVTLSLSGVSASSTIATKSDFNASATSTINVSVSGVSGTTYYYKYNFNDSNLSGASALTASSAPTISLASLSDGNNTLYVGVDSNSSGDFNLTEQNLTFVVDNTPPSTVSQSDVNYTTSSYDVTLNMPSGASSIFYSTDGGSNFTSTTSSTKTITLSQDENSSTTIVTFAEDSVGNESNRTSAVYTRNAAKTRILSASAVSFGSQNNLAKSTKNITVTNTGNSQTTIQSTNLSSSDFIISSNSCVSQIIAAAGTCTIAVDFNTSNSGSKNATLQIQYNGTSNSDLNVSLSGTGVNNIPVTTFTADVNISEDNNASGVLTATDIEGSSLSFFIDTNTTNGTISLETNGSFTYVPTANYNGTDSFVYYAYDGENNSTDRNITINIASVNDLPNVEVNGSTLSSISIDANSSFTINYEANDTADNQEVNISADINSTLGTVDINTTQKTVTFTPGSIARGNSNFFILTFSDGSGVDVNRTVNISWGNNKPSISLDLNVSTLSVTEDVNSSNNLISLSDSDGDNITISIESNASKGSISLSDSNITSGENNMTFTYTPNANVNGSDSFILKFEDGFGGITYQTITININAVNDAPTWSSISTQTTQEDTNLTVSLNASDIDNDILTYSAVASDGNNTVNLSVSNSTLTISPVLNQYGDINITVTVNDGNVSVTQNFDLNITAVNDAPTITTIPPRRFLPGSDNNGTYDINVTDVDNNDSSLNYDVNTTDGNTTVIVSVDNNGTLTFIPQDVNGTTTITVSVGDGNLTSTSSFPLTVKSTRATFSKDADSVSTDGNITTTSFNTNGKTLQLKENDNGKVSVTLDGTQDVNLVIDVVGADINVSSDGTLTTTLNDGGISKEIVVSPSGTTQAELNNNTRAHSLQSNYVDGESNTTVTSSGDIETKIIIGSNTVDITLNTNGTSTSSVSVGSSTTQITNTAIDTNTTVDSSGNVKATFTMQSKSIELQVSSTDGTITPSIPSAVLPSSFPAGTTTTIDNNSTIKFQLELPNKLEFN